MRGSKSIKLVYTRKLAGIAGCHLSRRMWGLTALWGHVLEGGRWTRSYYIVVTEDGRPREVPAADSASAGAALWLMA